MGNESAPIQLARCRFPGLAIFNAKILIYFFQIKYAEAILSNSARKLLWFEITKMLIAVLLHSTLFTQQFNIQMQSVQYATHNSLGECSKARNALTTAPCKEKEKEKNQ